MSSREFLEYKIGGGTALACTVTEETAGTVITVGNVAKESKAGDVLVDTGNPNQVELITADAWAAMNPVGADSVEPESPEPTGWAVETETTEADDNG